MSAYAVMSLFEGVDNVYATGNIVRQAIIIIKHVAEMKTLYTSLILADNFLFKVT